MTTSVIGDRRGARALRGAVVAALVLGGGLTGGLLHFVRSGLADPAPVVSANGLHLPPEVAGFDATPESSATSDVPDPGAVAPGPRSWRIWGTDPNEGNTERNIGDLQRADARILLSALGGATALILLVACANIALLLLARGRVDVPAIAMRRVLGETRLRSLARLLDDQAPLLVLGAILGGALASLVRTALQASWPSGLTPWLADGADPSVSAIALGLPLLSAALVALVPSLLIDEASLSAVVGPGVRATTSFAERRVRHFMSVIGIAVSVALLAAAGLLMRSFAPPAAAAIGFDPRDTLTFTIQPATSIADPVARAALYDRILGAAANAEGVRGVSGSSEGTWLGLGSVGSVHTLSISIARPSTGSARFASMSPGSLSALGAEVLTGRDLATTDDPSAPPVVIVNQTFANRYFFTSPIGRKVQLGRPNLHSTWFTVVGVFADVRPPGIGNGPVPEPMIVFSSLQLPPPTLALAARFSGDPEAVRASVEMALRSAAPDAALVFTGSMEEKLTEFRAPLAWIGLLFAGLAAFAALLGGCGLFGLITYDVSTRTREIGIRIALGSEPRREVRRIVLDGMRTSAKGLVLGLALAICVGRFLQSSFDGIRLFDPSVHLPIVALTAIITLVAAYLPARTAAAVDPATALLHG